MSFLFDTISAGAPTPISHVQVTLKGKKYDIEDVTTLSELQERIQEVSGIAPTSQGRILFQGKSLSKSGSESLSEAGVSEGDVLNCVPVTSSKKKKSSTGTTTTTAAKITTTSSTSTSGSVAASSEAKLQEMMQSAGVDTNAMEEMVNNMFGGGGGAPEGMPSMQESMEMMSNMMKSPMFTDFMTDPEKLEQTRQMILQNPMLKQMMASMPGMEELINDPKAWAAAMKATAEMYSKMDQDDLMNAIMQGAEASMGGEAGGIPPGLFDGMNGATPTALDELSEGEE